MQGKREAGTLIWVRSFVGEENENNNGILPRDVVLCYSLKRSRGQSLCINAKSNTINIRRGQSLCINAIFSLLVPPHPIRDYC